jgi:5-methyltetrahydropteroyltriglutamate--homocysteine methyltransferase
MSQQELERLYVSAVRDTIQCFEATGSPVITDGEQGKQSFATYSVHKLKNVSPNGIPILFADGHVRNFPRLTSGPFRYGTSADVYLEMAQRYAHVPVKQAVVSASALSLLYPQSGIRGYPRQDFLDALLLEQEGEIRRCLQKGAHAVQIDFTEGRLSIKLDPTRRLLASVFPPMSESGSASTAVPVVTGARVTAPRLTTLSCCRACSGYGRAFFTCSWPASPTASAC